MIGETVFTYPAPALKFGPRAADEIGHDLRQYDARRALVVADPGVAAAAPDRHERVPGPVPPLSASLELW